MITTYHHPTAGFALSLPDDWDRFEDSQAGVPLIAIEPEREDGGFRANLVVTVEQVPAGLDLAGWQAGTDDVLPITLHAYQLLDRERTELRGRAFIRRLAHHAREGSGSITMEQWATLAGGSGVTLTASCATLEYDTLAPMFGGVAEELRL